jgi:hypothetical protein
MEDDIFVSLVKILFTYLPWRIFDEDTKGVIGHQKSDDRKSLIAILMEIVKFRIAHFENSFASSSSEKQATGPGL